jgi:hypothetical protein
MEWVAFQAVESWWLQIVHAHFGRRKAMATLTILVSWELWNERNAEVFKNKNSTSLIMSA